MNSSGGDRWNQFNYVARNKELSTTEKTLFQLIFSYVNFEKGYAFPSIETLMKETPIKNRKTFFDNRKSLVDKGLIKIETIKGVGCKYYITAPSYEMKLGNKTEPSYEMLPTPSYEMKPTPSYEMLPQKEKEKKNKRKDIYIDLKFIDDVIDKVEITQEQYNKLIDKYNKDLVNSQIIALDNYIANGKGNKYKDHYRVLNTWCSKSKPKEKKVLTGMDLF